MITILALLILPLIATAFAAWNRSARTNHRITFDRRHRASAGVAALSRLAPESVSKRLVVGRGPTGWLFSHHPVAHVRSSGALFAGIPSTDAGAGI